MFRRLNDVTEPIKWKFAGVFFWGGGGNLKKRARKEGKCDNFSIPDAVYSVLKKRVPRLKLGNGKLLF